MQVPLNRENAFVGAGMAVGAGFGVLAYFLTKRKYEQIANEEIAAFKAEYSRSHEAKLESQAQARLNEMAKMDIVLTDSGYISPESTTTADLKEAIENNRNIFRDNANAETWDQEAEELARNTELPYIVSRDEYHEAQFGYSQINLTYFAGDDVLVDDENEVVPDIESLVGEDNLLKFGHGSGDNKVLYVRNEGAQMDFEITNSEHKYTEDVLGFIEHSYDKPGLRKFKVFD